MKMTPSAKNALDVLRSHASTRNLIAARDGSIWAEVEKLPQLPKTTLVQLLSMRLFVPPMGKHNALVRLPMEALAQLIRNPVGVEPTALNPKGGISYH